MNWGLGEAIQFGALGILALFVWYTIAKHLPKLIDTFREELKEQRNAHFEQDKRREEAFVKSLEGQRKDFREDVVILRTAFERGLEIHNSHAIKLRPEHSQEHERTA